ncbi:hypothetical protein [Novilysobacter erysipheiresistens]|uniref:Uncharacterized protein n=1 Tax=Novilysobacter erysipheiresistens TaxID=1749332 RepID=A0ABU7YY42_9GAMM
MSRYSKVVIWLSIVSGLLAVGSFWWWTRLMAADFEACLLPVVPAGVDCSHDLQFGAAVVFAIIALTLLLSLLIRRVRESFARWRGD